MRSIEQNVDHEFLAMNPQSLRRVNYIIDPAPLTAGLAGHSPAGHVVALHFSDVGIYRDMSL